MTKLLEIGSVIGELTIIAQTRIEKVKDIISVDVLAEEKKKYAKII